MPISNIEKALQPSRRMLVDCDYQAHSLCPGYVYSKGAASMKTECSCACHGFADDSAARTKFHPYDDVSFYGGQASPVRRIAPVSLEDAFERLRRRAQAGQEPATTDPTAIGMGTAEANWSAPEPESRRATRERLTDAAREIADKAVNPYDGLARLLRG
jgi:hypothetical protein